MADRPILYLGDTTLDTAAAYLAGLLTYWDYPFDYVPSNQPADTAIVRVPRKLFILSDYPAAMMSEPVHQVLLEQVSRGAGLIMIGGWESFHGQAGHWNDTPVGNALPVDISPTDDRVNCDQPALIAKRTDHPITNGLPWDTRPPTIGGHNAFKIKPDGEILLEVQRFKAQCNRGAFTLTPDTRSPLLVAGTHGQGRTAALATDLAPHWVGGLVDWGPERVTAQAAGADEIEVGNCYVNFVRQLVQWAGCFE